MSTLAVNMREYVVGSSLTTMKVGGVVRYHCRVTTVQQIKDCIAFAVEKAVPYAFYGAGSNLLLSDQGYDGLLIQIGGGTIQTLTTEAEKEYEKMVQEMRLMGASPSRYSSEDRPDVLHLKAQTDAPSSGPLMLVEMSAGVPWGQAVAHTLREGLAGLQWYARIPCTVGGAAYNNIHAQQHLLSEVICAVKSFNPATGEENIYSTKDLRFGYDYSLFHERNEVISAVIFALKKVLPEEAAANQSLYMGWTQQKAAVQPAGPSAGSVFKNITLEQATSINKQAVAAGWYIEQAGLKGTSVGGMKVYEGHANFIVNTGSGTQADFRELVKRIRGAVHEKFGIILEPEIECWDLDGNTVLWPPTIPK